MFQYRFYGLLREMLLQFPNNLIPIQLPPPGHDGGDCRVRPIHGGGALVHEASHDAGHSVLHRWVHGQFHP
jgi:hypothetical protein